MGARLRARWDSSRRQPALGTGPHDLRRPALVAAAAGASGGRAADARGPALGVSNLQIYTILYFFLAKYFSCQFFLMGEYKFCW